MFLHRMCMCVRACVRVCVRVCVCVCTCVHMVMGCELCAESALDAAFAKRLDNPNEQQALLTDEQMQVPCVHVHTCLACVLYAC